MRKIKIKRKRKRIRIHKWAGAGLAFLACSVMLMPGRLCLAAEKTENEITSDGQGTGSSIQSRQMEDDLIASPEEMGSREEVGEKGSIPITGRDVRDGVYTVEVESDSSMFRVVEASLTVESGDMSAVLTLGGKGYLKLYMGTGEEAVQAEEEAYAVYEENAEGQYIYTVPVEALNQELNCTAFSKRKEKWYDHTIFFDAASLPKDALLVELFPENAGMDENDAKQDFLESAIGENGQEGEYPQQKESAQEQEGKYPEQEEINLPDGVYEMEVELSGGSGRASIITPVKITVTNKKAVASIEWSSPNYDYMKVRETVYSQINTEGNSVFEIPVTVFDSEMAVIADTVAMSVPHEISYILIFHSDSVKEAVNPNLPVTYVIFGMCGAVIILCQIICNMKNK